MCEMDQRDPMEPQITIRSLFSNSQYTKEFEENAMSETHQRDPMEPQYTVYSLLAQFKNIKWPQDHVKSKIHDHLLKFRGKNTENPDEVSSEDIRKICKQASELLSPVPNSEWDYSRNFPKHGEAEDFPYEFQPKWFHNIGILLPYEPEVIEILPYLLTCYSQNARDNRIDPFTGKPGSAWMDIFKKYSDEKQNQLGAGNRSKSISQLIHYFTDFPKAEFSALFDAPTYEEIAIIDDPKQISYLPIRDMDSAAWKKAHAKAKKCAEAWERYCRFAAFCEACENEKMVNLTLSMAYFANAWDFGKCEEDSWPSPPSCEEISKDIQRELILNLMKRDVDPLIYFSAAEAKYIYSCCEKKRLPYNGLL